MVTSPIEPGFYTPTNYILLAAMQQDARDLSDRWMDEASEAALSGNPQRAGYVEYMAARLIGPTR